MPRLAYFHYDVTVCVEYCASFLAGPHWVLTLIWTRWKNGCFSNILFLHKNLLEYIANKVIEAVGVKFSLLIFSIENSQRKLFWTGGENKAMTNLNLSEGFHAGKTFTGLLLLKNKHSFPYHHNDVVLHTTAEFSKARLLVAARKLSPRPSNEETDFSAVPERPLLSRVPGASCSKGS